MTRTKQSVQRELADHYNNLNEVREKIAKYTELDAPIYMTNQRNQIEQVIAELEELLATGNLPDEKDIGTHGQTRESDSSINTGSGDYIGPASMKIGGNYIGGDYVGRDKIGHQEIVYGNKIIGTSLETLFKSVYQAIDARPEDLDVSKDEITSTVENIQKEATQGAQANSKKITRWLSMLGDMAPDILDVTVACLVNPAAGVAEVVRKVAEKAKGK